MNTFYSSFTLHSNIVESAPTAAVALWYFCRAQDRDGRGWVDLPVRTVATVVSRKPETVVRWLKEGKKFGFFREVKKLSVRLVRVYLSSRDKVCLRLGLESYGACGRISLNRLSNLKLASTEITTKALQRSSIHAALMQVKETDKSKLSKFIAPESLVRSWSYSNWANVIHGTQKRVYLDRDSVAVGVSQPRVGQALGRTRRTITRRLKGVSKKQVAQEVCFDRDYDLTYMPKCFSMCGRVFEMKCNIYDLPDVELTSARAARYFYRRKRLAQVGEE